MGISVSQISSAQAPQTTHDARELIAELQKKYSPADAANVLSMALTICLMHVYHGYDILDLREFLEKFKSVTLDTYTNILRDLKL